MATVPTSLPHDTALADNIYIDPCSNELIICPAETDHPISPSTTTDASSTPSNEVDGIRKLDIALEAELKYESLPTSSDANTIRTSSPNPYHNWECGFGFTGKFDAQEVIPITKAEFIEAVEGEIATVGFIQNGLKSYIKAINSGAHHVFSEDFLKSQNDASHKTISQLSQISENLRGIIEEVEVIEHDGQKIKDELREAFGHARPWIRRTRAVLISSHVFYKINYVLGSEKNPVI